MIAACKEIPADQFPLVWGGKLGGARVWRSLAFAGINWHPVINGRERGTPTSVYMNFLHVDLRLHTIRVNLHPVSRNLGATPGHPLGPDRRTDATKGDDEACYRAVAAEPCPALHAAPSGVVHVQIKCFPTCPRPSAQNCADHPGDRYPTSSVRESKLSPGAVPRGAFASGANYHRRPIKRDRAARASLSHDDLSAHQRRNFPCPHPATRCSWKLLARVRCLWISDGYNGQWPSLKRGKAPAGQKASRSLRRMKKKWRTKTRDHK